MHADVRRVAYRSNLSADFVRDHAPAPLLLYWIGSAVPPIFFAPCS